MLSSGGGAMTSHHHSSDHDPADTVDHPPPPPARWQQDDTASSGPRIRLMCSFGGRILPRPNDIQLRYVGGETRIVAVPRYSSFSALLSKLSKLTPSAADIAIKYQLPNEELDALISVTSDEDVDNMMEEYERLLPQSRTPPRLRLFLFPASDDIAGAGSGFGSILSDTGSFKHERWFLDALNGGRPLERGLSEVSSIVSEVPDYLFGLDNNSDEPAKQKTSVSVSDPGSPAPAVSSPHYWSASSAQWSATATVEIKPDEPEVNPYVPPPAWQYVPEPVPVYYVPGPVHGGNLPFRPAPAPVPVPYVQHVHQVAQGQIPVGYRPVYVSGGPGTYDYTVGPAVVGTRSVPMYQPTMGIPPSPGESPIMGSSARGSQ